MTKYGFFFIQAGFLMLPAGKSLNSRQERGPIQSSLDNRAVYLSRLARCNSKQILPFVSRIEYLWKNDLQSNNPVKQPAGT